MNKCNKVINKSVEAIKRMIKEQVIYLIDTQGNRVLIDEELKEILIKYYDETLELKEERDKVLNNKIDMAKELAYRLIEVIK